MALSETVRCKEKSIKINIFVIIIFVILGIVILFLVTNLIAIIELRKQVELILNDTAITYHIKSGTETSTSVVVNNEVISTSTSIATITPVIGTTDFIKKFSNITTEPFFGSYLIDNGKTNMYLDDAVTAMTFLPAYSFKMERKCGEMLCGFLVNRPQSLNEVNSQVYYKDKKVDLPLELKDKKIINFNFSLLTTKWVIGIVTSENNQEVGYVYLFDGKKLEPLITSTTSQQMKTQYNHTGGSISAGGSDNQFIVLYSGYEGIGYFYNNGIWQNLSPYFGLRVMKGGFKAKIIKGGSGNLTNWYVCSDTINKPKLIKLWQNNTENIQGSLDLSKILDGGTAICNTKTNRELSIARNINSEESALYNFIDNGFDNSHNYSYQSINLSDYAGKKITNVKLRAYTINAPVNLYSITASNDLINWQSSNNYSFDFSNSSSSSFYLKANFKTREADYSPWFGGLELISYEAQEIKSN